MQQTKLNRNKKNYQWEIETERIEKSFSLEKNHEHVQVRRWFLWNDQWVKILINYYWILINMYNIYNEIFSLPIIYRLFLFIIK